MARKETIEPDDDYPPQEDLDAARNLFPPSDRYQREQFRQRPMPPNPSEPRRVTLDSEMLRQILPQLQQNSNSAAEYEENLRRVIMQLFKHQFNGEPDPIDVQDMEDTIKLQMQMYEFQNGLGSNSRVGPLQQHRRELEEYQEEFRRQNEN